MDAKELRIGNWITFNGNQGAEPCQIQGYELWGHNEYLNKCIPIPLTEEWLVKFGFVNGNNSNSSNCDRWGNWYREELFKLTKITQNEFNADIYCCELTVKYVHQLQNLYFALTGEELTTS